MNMREKCQAVIPYSSRQNAGVSGSSRENISSRPASMRKELSHSVASFKGLHELSGPMKCPTLGPTLLNEVMASPNASSS